MKQKDILLIAGVALISVFASIILSSKILVKPQNRQQEVEVVEAITAEFSTPDPKYFNKDSVNPTKLIEIGDSNNQQPFDSGQ